MTKKLGWVRITKTGSALFQIYLEEKYGNDIVIGLDACPHLLKTSSFDSDITPILTLRDPFDRFLSSYNYYLYGSDMNQEHITKERMIWKRTENIKEFIEIIFPQIQSLSTEAYCREYFYKETIKHDYIWKAHMQPQTEWIKEQDYKRTIFVNYHRDMISVCNNVSRKLQEIFGLPEVGEMKQFRINQTIKNKQLDKESLNYCKSFVEEFYVSDYELLEKLKNDKSLFHTII